VERKWSKTTDDKQGHGRVGINGRTVVGWCRAGPRGEEKVRVGGKFEDDGDQGTPEAGSARDDCANKSISGKEKHQAEFVKGGNCVPVSGWNGRWGVRGGGGGWWGE